MNEHPSGSAGARRCLLATCRRFALTALVAIVFQCMASAPAAAIGVGARGPDVYVIQGMLKSLGCYAGPIDGVYGEALADSVRFFQWKYGLPVTGSVDNRTLENILWAYANLKLPQKPSQPEPAPTPAPPPVPKKGEGPTPEGRQMLDLVNGERRTNGLRLLEPVPEMTKAARAKSADMVANGYFSHQSPTYGSPSDLMMRFGIPFSTVGENIACNRSVQDAHQALMNSPGHRDNILKPSYTSFGVGIIDGGPCSKIFVQLFAE